MKLLELGQVYAFFKFPSKPLFIIIGVDYNQGMCIYLSLDNDETANDVGWYYTKNYELAPMDVIWTGYLGLALGEASSRHGE